MFSGLPLSCDLVRSDNCFLIRSHYVCETTGDGSGRSVDGSVRRSRLESWHSQDLQLSIECVCNCCRAISKFARSRYGIHQSPPSVFNPVVLQAQPTVLFISLEGPASNPKYLYPSRTLLECGFSTFQFQHISSYALVRNSLRKHDTEADKCVDQNNQLHIYNLLEYGRPKIVTSVRFDRTKCVSQFIFTSAFNF